MRTIRAENISKLYRLGERAPNSLRDFLTGIVRRRGGGRRSKLWALRDINFEVSEGETLGIIGRNGAGKSTLLKILSRITKPTTGRAEIRGRVGSLLEVGTGFHGELSGRENIFLNGAILGMKRAEIERKFDEIVAFSEVEEFLDTPVKHYSSGMYMRLAFAVAAHLEPEVLIVDEVLAVGDIAFQRKCLSKIREVGHSGRTVLFVTHDMSAVARICDRTIILEGGRIVADGPPMESIQKFVSGTLGQRAERVYDTEGWRPESDVVRLLGVRVVDRDGKTCGSFDIRHDIGIEATYEVLVPGHILIPNFQVYDQQRVHVFTVQDVIGDGARVPKDAGIYTSTAWIPGNFMAEGNFVVNAAVVTYLPHMNVHFNAQDAVTFDIFDPMTGDTARGDYAGTMEGVVRPVLEWHTERR
ncbi:MAG: polysaccharide ABC transporter ATP-binding protein [Pyrinomonadaceae bacterium]